MERYIDEMKFLQKRQKRLYTYDAWLHWSVTVQCNLNCIYCPLVLIDTKKDREINEIDVSSLLRALRKADKVFLIFFTGGEPFLVTNFIRACMEISKSHYIGLKTNLTSSTMREFVKSIDPERVLFFTASCHFKQLDAHNLLSQYVNNFLLCRQAGFNINAAAVAHPSFLQEAETYKKLFVKKGIRLIFEPFVGEYQGKHYPRAYTNEELRVFGMSQKDIQQYYPRFRVCNAGYNICKVLPTGKIHSCWCAYDYLGNIYKKINFKETMKICSVSRCACPFSTYYTKDYLFKKAVREKLNFSSLLNLFRCIPEHICGNSLSKQRIFFEF